MRISINHCSSYNFLYYISKVICDVWNVHYILFKNVKSDNLTMTVSEVHSINSLIIKMNSEQWNNVYYIAALIIFHFRDGQINMPGCEIIWNKFSFYIVLGILSIHCLFLVQHIWEIIIFDYGWKLINCWPFILWLVLDLNWTLPPVLINKLR